MPHITFFQKLQIQLTVYYFSKNSYLLTQISFPIFPISVFLVFQHNPLNIFMIIYYHAGNISTIIPINNLVHQTKSMCIFPPIIYKFIQRLYSLDKCSFIIIYYSTVTLFARLRGLSTSNPFATLM